MVRDPGSRTSWGALADAVGHSVLVFAFLPALAPVPGWLAFEAQNALNRTDGVVLMFLPVRGAVLLLNAFWEGMIFGIPAGILNGALFSTWATRTHDRPSTPTALAVGALTGTLAATTMVTIATGSVPWSGPAAFELISGSLCGAVAAPSFLRLLRRGSERAAQNGSDARREGANADGECEPASTRSTEA